MIDSVATPLHKPWCEHPRHPHRSTMVWGVTTPGVAALSPYGRNWERGIPPTHGRGARLTPRTPDASEERSVSGGPIPRRAHARERTKAETKIENQANREIRKVCKLKRKTNKNQTAVDRAVEQMPPLRHSLPIEPFNICKSEVAQWLCSQPEIMQWVFDTAKDRGAIVYDAETGTWRGANHAG